MSADIQLLYFSINVTYFSKIHNSGDWRNGVALEDTVVQHLDLTKIEIIIICIQYCIVFTNSNIQDFKNHVDIEFESLNELFKANGLCLSNDKRHFIQCASVSILQIDLDIVYVSRLACKAHDTEFLETYFDRTLYCKIHISEIKCSFSSNEII
jgi:hypothetical protein